MLGEVGKWLEEGERRNKKEGEEGFGFERDERGDATTRREVKRRDDEEKGRT